MRSKAFFSSLIIGLLPLTLSLSACSDDDADTPPGPDPSADAGDGGAGGEGGQGGDGDDDAGAGGDGGDDTDGGDGGAGGDGGDGGEEPVGCRQPGPADADRIVVTGHRYGEVGYQVVKLASDGTLSTTGKRFTMGKPTSQPIVFTPDGKLGFAPQDDGTLGVFRVKDDGEIEVLHEDFGKGEFYVESVVMAPTGDHLYGVDVNWPENGGGLYRVDIDCDDDTLTIQPRFIEGKGARGMAFLSPTEAFVAARELGPDTQVNESVHRLSLTDPPSVLASLDLFGDDDAIVSAVALTRDKKFAIVGDNNEYTGNPTRLGFVGIGDTGLVGKGVSSEVNDPVGVVASPFNDAILVASGYNNRIYLFDYDPAASDTPFTFRGELEGARPQLPAAPVSIERGALDGRVLLPVVDGIYQVQFAEGGELEDLGVFAVGESIEGMVSNIGVQP